MNITIESTSLDLTVTGGPETLVNVTGGLSHTVVVQPNGLQGPAGPVGGRGASGTQPVFSRSGLLEPTVGASRFYVEEDAVIGRVRASLGTPSGGSPVVVDVLANDVSVLDSPVEIPAGDFTAAVDFAVPVLAGTFLTVSILSVGTAAPGADLTIAVTFI